ncbi:hypothetical protein B0F90DRAFT_1668776 [Multifurca ochricompacta]|uniref:Uncharacterized protein n=1 Tax=Multifurca ochricompacta TaxID=376703 RepID=A0AAD4M218_9AGAM|nr:hypothetical protein B0F90DRAFT_1668776 [Multifurca ochricompacta]
MGIISQQGNVPTGVRVGMAILPTRGSIMRRHGAYEIGQRHDKVMPSGTLCHTVIRGSMEWKYRYPKVMCQVQDYSIEDNRVQLQSRRSESHEKAWLVDREVVTEFWGFLEKVEGCREYRESNQGIECVGIQLSDQVAIVRRYQGVVATSRWFTFTVLLSGLVGEIGQFHDESGSDYLEF